MVSKKQLLKPEILFPEKIKNNIASGIAKQLQQSSNKNNEAYFQEEKINALTLQTVKLNKIKHSKRPVSR